MKTGDKVKMSESLKRTLINMGCEDHVKEFGDCEGTIEDKVYEDDTLVNVRWLPLKLRYAYYIDELIKI